MTAPVPGFEYPENVQPALLARIKPCTHSEPIQLRMVPLILLDEAAFGVWLRLA